uniref:Uncharacterized protein n=1 Tax=Aegilops tauschii subsp. strangulata TaxID=200361 RepID=A0A453GWQ8_AEGTS
MAWSYRTTSSSSYNCNVDRIPLNFSEENRLPGLPSHAKKYLQSIYHCSM